jgi:hypothetical protein
MPVVTTMTIIALMRGGGTQDLPFSNPEVLRGLLDNALAGEADGTLKEALTIADELETLLNRYRASVESSIDVYIEESSNRYTAAPELIERLEPLDCRRTRTLQTVIELRQSLFELLSDEQWEAVFN